MMNMKRWLPTVLSCSGMAAASLLVSPATGQAPPDQNKPKQAAPAPAKDANSPAPQKKADDKNAPTDAKAPANSNKDKNKDEKDAANKDAANKDTANKDTSNKDTSPKTQKPDDAPTSPADEKEADDRNADQADEPRDNEASNPNKKAAPANKDRENNRTGDAQRRGNPADREKDRAKTGKGDTDRTGRQGGKNISTNLGITWQTGADNQLIVGTVAPRSAFTTIGLRKGDRLVSVDGREFDSDVAFASWLVTVRAGQRLPLVVYREGREQTIYWTPTEEFVQSLPQDDADPNQSSGNLPVVLGIQLEDQSADSAAIVASVTPNSPAARGGVKPGDMIVAMNGQEIGTGQQFVDLANEVAPNAPLTLSVSRVVDLQIGVQGARAASPQASRVVPANAVEPVPAPVRAGATIQTDPAPRTAPAPARQEPGRILGGRR